MNLTFYMNSINFSQSKIPNNTVPYIFFQPKEKHMGPETLQFEGIQHDLHEFKCQPQANCDRATIDKQKLSKLTRDVNTGLIQSQARISMSDVTWMYPLQVSKHTQTVQVNDSKLSTQLQVDPHATKTPELTISRPSTPAQTDHPIESEHERYSWRGQSLSSRTAPGTQLDADQHTKGELERTPIYADACLSDTNQAEDKNTTEGAPDIIDPSVTAILDTQVEAEQPVEGAPDIKSPSQDCSESDISPNTSGTLLGNNLDHRILSWHEL